MVTIFDLQKGQEVWGGLMPQGQGFAKGCASATKLQLTRILWHYENLFGSMEGYFLPIRLQYGCEMIINANNLFEGKIYPSQEDFINGENEIQYGLGKTFVNESNGQVIVQEFHNEIFPKLGISGTDIWTWDEEQQKSVLAKKFIHTFDLLDLKLPEGYYATKEACEKANKKLVKVKVETESIYELEPEDAEYLLQNPGEYADFDANIKEHSSFAQSVQ